jgi:hypothetical protein
VEIGNVDGLTAGIETFLEFKISKLSLVDFDMIQLLLVSFHILQTLEMHLTFWIFLCPLLLLLHTTNFSLATNYY